MEFHPSPTSSGLIHYDVGLLENTAKTFIFDGLYEKFVKYEIRNTNDEKRCESNPFQFQQTSLMHDGDHMTKIVTKPRIDQERYSTGTSQHDDKKTHSAKSSSTFPLLTSSISNSPLFKSS